MIAVAVPVLGEIAQLGFWDYSTGALPVPVAEASQTPGWCSGGRASATQRFHSIVLQIPRCGGTQKVNLQDLHRDASENWQIGIGHACPSQWFERPGCCQKTLDWPLVWMMTTISPCRMWKSFMWTFLVYFEVFGGFGSLVAFLGCGICFI